MSSWTYADCCLIVRAGLYANSDPRRVKSKASVSGLKSGFTVSPPRHWLTVVKAVLSDGLPLASRHGELTVGSVKPSVKFSASFVALMVPPTFTLWLPAAYARSALIPRFVSFRFWLMVPGWSANGSGLGVYVT